MRIQRFLRDTRAGATATTAATVTALAIGGTGQLSDTAWLVDQRDLLEAASDATGIAATQEMFRLMDTQPGSSDADLESAPIREAWRYAVPNLGQLPEKRLTRAKSSLVVEVTPNRSQRAVGVWIQADLSGTLLSKDMPMFGDAVQPRPMRAETVVESTTNPIAVVLALDMSQSMHSRLDGRLTCDRCPDSRINTVKRVAATLGDILQPDSDNRIAVGVVSWNHAVRLDSEAAAEWNTNNWARYPTRRVYGEHYACRGNNCTPPPAAVEHALPSTAPEAWNGWLDSHRTETLEHTVTPDIRASVSTDKFFTLPSKRTHPASTAGREVRSGGAGGFEDVGCGVGLCGQGLVASGFPIPGHQLVYPGARYSASGGSLEISETSRNRPCAVDIPRRYGPRAKNVTYERGRSSHLADHRPRYRHITMSEVDD